jgi:hypothetical protein
MERDWGVWLWRLCEGGLAGFILTGVGGFPPAQTIALMATILLLRETQRGT